jgi:hypothetical protein
MIFARFVAPDASSSFSESLSMAVRFFVGVGEPESRLLLLDLLLLLLLLLLLETLRELERDRAEPLLDLIKIKECLESLHGRNMHFIKNLIISSWFFSFHLRARN